MRCRRAKRALIERGLGLLDRTETLELARHLETCRACGREALAEQAFRRSMRTLRVDLPFELDVRERVAAAIAGRRPAREERPATGQLGWAAGLAAAVAVGLTVWLLALWPEARALLGSARLAAGVVVELGVRLIGTAATVLAAPVRALVELAGAASSELPPADVLRPLAESALGLGFMVMIGTILLVVGRDLRRRPALGLGEGRR